MRIRLVVLKKGSQIKDPGYFESGSLSCVNMKVEEVRGSFVDLCLFHDVHLESLVTLRRREGLLPILKWEVLLSVMINFPEAYCSFF